MREFLGKTVTMMVDRPLGSHHPRYPDMIYPINYGYIAEIIGGDGEAQDAYLIGVDVPVEAFEGHVIAVIHRLDDHEDKWVIAPPGKSFTTEEIMQAVQFQEQYFRCEIFVSA